MPDQPAKERVVTTLGGGIPDRVPVDYSANAGIDARLKQHFGLRSGDGPGLLQALGVDFRGVNPPIRGPKRHADIPDRGVRVDHWGVHRRWVQHGSGGYWDFCDFPLRDADVETVAAWPLPSPDDFDYSGIAQACRRWADYAVFTGHAGTGDVINSSGFLRGMEQVLVDLITDNPAGLLLARRKTDIQLEVVARTLEAARGGIDFLWLGEDLGTQRGPTISLDLFRRHIRPIHQRFVDLAKSYDLPVMIHCCGASSWAFEDFIEMGIKAVDTLQPEAQDMAPASLKSRFGGRLAFHGCISTAGPIATGTVADTEADCRQVLAAMMPGGGYCFAPTHCLQDNSPTENVLAAYRVAATDGVY